MPPAIVAAGIGAAGALGGAALSSRASNKATDAQERSTNQALAFQREQAARAEAAYKQQYDAWLAGRQALLQRYGIDIAPPAPTQMAPAQAPLKSTMVGPRQTLSMGELIQRGPVGGPGEWNDWSQLGLRG